MPLVKVKILLNDKLEINGVNDSGLNVSLVNYKVMKFNEDGNKLEQYVNVNIIDGHNFKYEFLIRLR